VREFQTIQENTIGGVTLVANTFKDLPAGNYYISAESYVPGSLGHSSQLKVYDSTHAADLLLGAPGYVLSGPTSGPNFKIDVKGRFTLAAKSDIQIIAGVRDTTVSIGLGNLATAVFGDNVHGEVEIWRLPTPA
jgi:hypothetical protein